MIFRDAIAQFIEDDKEMQIFLDKYLENNSNPKQNLTSKNIFFLK